MKPVIERLNGTISAGASWIINVVILLYWAKFGFTSLYINSLLINPWILITDHNEALLYCGLYIKGALVVMFLGLKLK